MVNLATMKTTTLAQLTDLVNKFRAARDWKQFHNPKDIAITLNLEAAEVLEHVQWRNGDELMQYLKSHKEDLADELADVLHSLLILAHDLDINLAQAFIKKMEKNAKKYPVHKSKGSARKWTEL